MSAFLSCRRALQRCKRSARHGRRDFNCFLPFKNICAGKDLQYKRRLCDNALLIFDNVGGVSRLSEGFFDLSQGAPYMLAAIFGGAFGAFLLDRLNSKTMKVIFALLVVWAGISMVIKL